MTDTLEFLSDISGNAHALLSRNWPTQYPTLLAAYHSRNREEELKRVHIDNHNSPKLFYGLLAFAQPEIFKAIHSEKRCFTLLTHALKYMYRSPLEIEHANELLDDQLEE